MFNYPAVMGALSIVKATTDTLEASLVGYGVTKLQLQKAMSPAPWIGGERAEVRRTLDSLIYASVDAAGLPRIDLPAEFVAAVLAIFVHPTNLMVACVFMEGRHNWVDDVARAANDPVQGLERVSASELFGIICEILGDVEHPNVRTTIERKMARKVSDPVS